MFQGREEWEVVIVPPSAGRFWEMSGKNHKEQLEIAITEGIRVESRERDRKEEERGEFSYTHIQTPVTSFTQRDLVFFF